MKQIGRFSSILDIALGYRLFGQLVRGNGPRIYLDEYAKPIPGEKVLDIGCGPGDILSFLPEVDYTGFDISPTYISAAKKRFGNRGRFFCHDVGAGVIAEIDLGTFDLVLARGVVHHLDDGQAAGLFALARSALRPLGRLVTLDGCYVPNQSKIARWLLDKDRGKFVRTHTEYLRLSSSGSFSKVEAHLRHDLLRIPYTHLIMQCCK